MKTSKLWEPHSFLNSKIRQGTRYLAALILGMKSAKSIGDLFWQIRLRGRRRFENDIEPRLPVNSLLYPA